MVQRSPRLPPPQRASFKSPGRGERCARPQPFRSPASAAGAPPEMQAAHQCPPARPARTTRTPARASLRRPHRAPGHDNQRLPGNGVACRYRPISWYAVPAYVKKFSTTQASGQGSTGWPSSSCSSRTRACAAVPPASMPPPGNAQKASPTTRCSSTRPSLWISAAARWRTRNGLGFGVGFKTQLPIGSSLPSFALRYQAKMGSSSE